MQFIIQNYELLIWRAVPTLRSAATLNSYMRFSVIVIYSVPRGVTFRAIGPDS
jgi:hypothetical protein